MKRIGIAVVLAVILGFAVSAMAGGPKCIDVETATAKQLQDLKGVGPALAKAIVDYRKKERTAATKAKKAKWNFRNWATVLKVKGVGAQVCKDNLAKVCFGKKVQKTCPKVDKK
jgi:competence protein ComEA